MVCGTAGTWHVRGMYVARRVRGMSAIGGAWYEESVACEVYLVHGTYDTYGT